jgi:archaellum component FlaF (FlaF/FlaG flagellin family)
MGFSVVIASFIVLIGFVTVFSTVATVMFSSTQDLTFAANDYISKQQDKLNAQMQLTVDSISATQCQITLKNIGSKQIFFQNSNGFSWNSIILSYGKTNQWHAYQIETFTVQQIEVSSTNTTLNTLTHNYVNPGEQATILVDIPGGAPQIATQDIVSVTFASYYGTTASSEGVMA